MRKVVLEAFGGPEVLRPVDAPEPEAPRDGWVVELAAIGINFAELVERRGRYRKGQSLPYEIGKEACGRVVAAGPDARGFEVGERVIVIRFAGACYAERVAVRPGELLRPPAHLDDDEAAAFAVSYATAWYAQVELARLREGESVLVQAAAGALGTAAVRLARALGAGPVLGTAGGDAKCDLVRSLGADACVDYRVADFRETVREHTDGRGVDYCLESVGGDVLDRSFQTLAPTGRIVCLGFSSVETDHADRIKRIHPLELFHRSIGVFGLNVENLDFPRRDATWRALVEVAERHELRPVVGPRFPLERAADAHAAIEARETTGKVLLVP